MSAAINPHGSPGRVLDAVLDETHTVLHQDRILSEYREVLIRPVFGSVPTDIDAMLDFLEFTGEHTSSRDLGVTLPHPSDMPFLEVAAAGRADVLITGNLKHFKLARARHSVFVCIPPEFLKRAG